MTPPILLTGGTGTLGRLVATLLRDDGCAVRVLSRHPHEPVDDTTFVVGDLDTGAGIDLAVAGAETVVHCAGAATGDEAKARTLVQAAERAGVRHLVHISVVGAERVPVISRLDRTMFGYFAMKRSAERVVEDSGLAWTTLRASQFHDLAFTTAVAMAKLPVIPVPSGMRFQPVDAREVAARMTELALGPPSGLVDDFAGPHIYGMDELVRSYLTASHRRRLLVPMRVPGTAARAIRAGANLAPAHAVGTRTWEDFLAERIGSGAVAS